jgi:hypothetical protein
LCIARADSILDVPVQEANWLNRLWHRAADVFLQDAGDQDLIGQVFFGGSSIQYLKVGGRSSDIDPNVLAQVAPGGFPHPRTQRYATNPSICGKARQHSLS